MSHNDDAAPSSPSSHGNPEVQTLLAKLKEMGYSLQTAHAVLTFAHEKEIYDLPTLMDNYDEVNLLLAEVSDDPEDTAAPAATTGILTLGTSSHEEMKERAQDITYATYASMAGYLSVALMTTFVTGYIIYMFGTGGPFLPVSKKPLVVTLAALLATFPGIKAFLPPGPNDGDYPADYSFVAWLAVPQSKSDAVTMAKAFFPLAKPYQDWEHSAATGKPSDTNNMWTPLTVFDAMLRAPAQLLGLPADTNPSFAKPKLIKALREAAPAVRHFLLLPCHYIALQNHVVATAFKLPKVANVKDIVPNRCKKFPALPGLPSITINFTDMVIAYHAYIHNPTTPGVYPKMMRAISYGIDKHGNFQGHTYTQGNTLKMLDKVTQDKPKPKESTADKQGSPIAPSAGATARSVVSPGRPGAPKSLRYADATRGRVVASTIANAPGPNNPSGPQAPTPMPPTPAVFPAGPPNAPSAPAGYGAPGFYGPPPGFPGYYPMAPGHYWAPSGHQEQPPNPQ